MRGGGLGNLSPPAHLPLPSSSVSGMGGMSSVPCARERAELVRAWWVTASGSGVAICGDTGTKLDRPVPAGFETVPQGIRVNLRVRDAPGITTKHSNPDTMSAVHPAPLSSLQGSARGGFRAGWHHHTLLSPGSFRGLAAFQKEAQPDPGTGPGKWREWGERRESDATPA